MVNVAILGFGTVGSGVAEVIAKNNQQIAQRVSNPIEVKYVLDVRDFPSSPFADKVIHDFSIIENDPEVDVVVETIGGAKIALDFTRRALLAGKSVVTSNKELVATHGYELMQIAKEKNVSYLYEASVGGGIPILKPIRTCLAANELSEITGILNGTTNYILTRMIRAGLSFEDALKEAQANGYAEQNPAADIEGHDACRKICILASLGFGRQVSPEQVPTEGITSITLADVDYARSAGMKIKLLGRAIRRESDNKVCAFVAPHLVSDESPLANVEGVFNAISVVGDAIGDVMFYGQGAGKLPTASAVVADVMDAAKHHCYLKNNSWEAGGDDVVYSVEEIKSRWYARLGDDAPVPGAKALHAAGAAKGESAWLTEQKLTPSEVKALLDGREVRSLYRVLE
ncbi:MAG: homoserine dehydrogenase [Oscillospiraceae bacterium]|nr:homoserine dehydrogenase [Oscillospiraceae bacterium]